jgi:hypothetical protein
LTRFEDSWLAVAAAATAARGDQQREGRDRDAPDQAAGTRSLDRMILPTPLMALDATRRR